MTRAEIRRHALAIAEMRRSNRSKAAIKRQERGHGTPLDFVPGGRVQMVSRYNADSEVGAVDDVFRARDRAGFMPKGSWS